MKLSIVSRYCISTLLAASSTLAYAAFSNEELTQIEVGAYAPSAVPDRITLTISGDPSSQMAINWRTDNNTEAAIAQIAVADGTPDQEDNAITYVGNSEEVIGSDYTAYHHSVVFEGLEADTKYIYRVGDGQVWSEWAQFTTAEGSTSRHVAPFSFIYFGDAQNDLKSRWARVIREAYSDMPEAEFLLHAGDLVNTNDDEQEWGEWFYSAGWINSSMPSVATPGNHEYGRSGDLSPMWRPHFTFPENGPDDAALAETVYYFDYQGVRFISLDTQAMSSRTNGEASAIAQAEWLEPLLADNPNRWTIVYHHHPMFPASVNRPTHEMLNTYFKDLYEEYGVDLVLQGHDHSYARGDNLGTGRFWYDGAGPVYVVSVAGPKMYTSDAEWADVTGDNLQLYQLIDVKQDELDYRAFTADGQPYDQFVIKKHTHRRDIHHKEKGNSGRDDQDCGQKSSRNCGQTNTARR